VVVGVEVDSDCVDHFGTGIREGTGEILVGDGCKSAVVDGVRLSRSVDGWTEAGSLLSELGLHGEGYGTAKVRADWGTSCEGQCTPHLQSLELH
jgi:hypothetical protein